MTHQEDADSIDLKIEEERVIKRWGGDVCVCTHFS